MEYRENHPTAKAIKIKMELLFIFPDIIKIKLFGGVNLLRNNI